MSMIKTKDAYQAIRSLDPEQRTDDFAVLDERHTDIFYVMESVEEVRAQMRLALQVEMELSK